MPFHQPPVTAALQLSSTDGTDAITTGYSLGFTALRFVTSVAVVWFHSCRGFCILREAAPYLALRNRAGKHRFINIFSVRLHELPC